MITDAVPLASAFLGKNLVPAVSDDNSSVSLHLLWSSNTSGVIMNGRTTSDGRMYFAHCLHTIDISPVEDKHVDRIQPSRFSLPPEKRRSNPFCAGDQDDTCLKIYMAYIIMTSWNAGAERVTASQSVMYEKACQRGALIGRRDNPDKGCVIADDAWTKTLAATAEAVMEASEKQGSARQELWVAAKSISKRRWWLQVIIPGSTFVLYVASIVWVFFLNRSKEPMKELSVSEIAVAAVPEPEVQEYAQRRDAIDDLTVGGLPAAFLAGDITNSLDRQIASESMEEPSGEEKSGIVSYPRYVAFLNLSRVSAQHRKLQAAWKHESDAPYLASAQRDGLLGSRWHSLHVRWHHCTPFCASSSHLHLPKRSHMSAAL